MEQWEQDFVDEKEEGYFEFDVKGWGSFHFGYVHGTIDGRLTTKEGEPAIEWTWDGNDEMEDGRSSKTATCMALFFSRRRRFRVCGEEERPGSPKEEAVRDE